MIPFKEAYMQIMNAVRPLGEEVISLTQALGRINAREIHAQMNIPPWNNSAMDGFAVHSSITSEATSEKPVILTVVDEFRAGQNFRSIDPIHEYASVRIMTGALIPPGADAVIPVENVEESDNRIIIKQPINHNDNIRFAGEDIKMDSIVLIPGLKIRPSAIGLLASLNHNRLHVYRCPKVAVLTTGDEIVELGSDARYGQIYNSNAYTLIASLAQCNCTVTYLGIVGDDREVLMDVMKNAFQHDVVISTGGISKGKYDLVPEILGNIGVDLKIRGVAMKPGKPFIWGMKDQVMYFGLPGNPVSTLITFEEFVRPALLKLSGARLLNRPIIKATFKDTFEKKAGRCNFIRGIYSLKNGFFTVQQTGPQGSGILRSMNEANCIIVFDEATTCINNGDQVEIQLIQHEEYS